MNENQRSNEQIRSMAEALGPAEKLVDLIINFPDHLWHNRPGVIREGKWKPASRDEIREFHENGQLSAAGADFRQPGPNREAIVKAYRTLSEIWKANNELAARLASYIQKETDWRDMKVLCAAFMLVQNRAGEPEFEELAGGGREVLFHDDDFREVGEAMIKFYRRGSDKMMNPKLILRIRDVLNLEEVAAINRELGFGNPHARRPFTGRYYKAVKDWLEFRETNASMLEGLRNAGYTSTVKNLARMVGYKPKSQRFFEVLGWKQKQAAEGHRELGLDGSLEFRKISFEGLDERGICELISSEKLGWKQVMGMLPAEIGLTPAIFVAMLDRFSDKDLVILTPTLEEFALLDHEIIRDRWSEALANQKDQRARNVARNLKSREHAEKLEAAADEAVVKVVEEATADANVHVMFLIDVSGSMEGAIELSREALSMIVQGFPEEKLHISSFNTVGNLLRPRHYSAKGIRHMLRGIAAEGGTTHTAGVAAFYVNGVRIPENADLVIFVVGDEAGEPGENFAANIKQYGYRPAAFAHIVNVAAGWQRGRTVRHAAAALGVGYTEVEVDQFRDVYQVGRTLKAILEAAPLRTKESLVEKILSTEMLEKPY